MKNIFLIYKKPIIFSHNDLIYKELIFLLKEKINKLTPISFEFSNNKGELIQEKYRYIYQIDQIVSDIKISSLMKKFATEIVPKFIMELKKEIDEPKYNLNFSERLRYCLRIRVIEDKEQYSLQPHKDSADTIFSFILQLDSNNTRTALYKKRRQFKLNGKFSENLEDIKLQVASVVSKICPNEKIHFGESQFRKNIGLWTNNKFFRYEKINDWIGLQEFDEELIDTNHGNIYGICNSLVDFICSSKLIEANESNYHGVRPIIQKSRKLLIMDLIAQPTTRDVLVMQGVNNDKNSYFLIYGPEKCRELTDLLS